MELINKIKKVFFKGQKPQRSFYEAIGEEKGVHELVKNFYQIMEIDPVAKDCLATHPVVEGIVPDEVKKKLFLFLVGWFGGPQLFIQNYGPPRMRARHGHVKITEKERDQWLYCMQYSLERHSAKLTKIEKSMFLNSFKALANRIQNH